MSRSGFNNQTSAKSKTCSVVRRVQAIRDPASVDKRNRLFSGKT
jgi:hypothetical protein